MSATKNQPKASAASPLPGNATLSGKPATAVAEGAADPVALSQDERLMHAANRAEKAVQAHDRAEELKKLAGTLKDPSERERILKDAYNKEMEALSQSKMAKRLQSGTVQGAIGGAGIGGAVGAGLGTLVGTVVGGVLTLPTTAVGGLIGSGVGAIHGPFVKFGQGAKKKTGEGVSESVDPTPSVQPEPLTVPDPKGLRQAAQKLKEQRAKEAEEKSAVSKTASDKKRNPRRDLPPTGDGQPRRRPKKLEVR